MERHRDQNDTRPEEPEIILPFDDLGTTRRSFLRLAGFGIAAVTLHGCGRAPESRTQGFVQAQEGVIGGKAYTIATGCHGCPAGCGVLAKCRDGRPVKLEGNSGHPLSRGGLCAVGQAAVLSLYDSLRFDGPRHRGAAASWNEADQALRAALAAAKGDRGRVRVLTGTITGPSTLHAIDAFVHDLPDARHVVYDALGGSAILDAHAATHGRRILPHYRFDQATTIGAFDADFLGTWISPVAFARDWAAGRRPDTGRMSRHWQFEARMSITGGCADERFRLAPWEMEPALRALRDALGGVPMPAATPQKAALERLAAELRAAPGKGLVVCGSNDPACQTLVNEINAGLGAYGKTIDLDRPSLARRGDDAALATLLGELDAGAVDLVIVHGANPAYDLPADAAKRLRRAKLLVTTAPLRDETADLADWVLPEPHALERWDDAEPRSGTLTLTQPAIAPLRSTRTLRATLAAWRGDARADRDLLEDFWRAEVHPRSRDGGAFRRFFRKALHDGFATIDRKGDGAAMARPAPASRPASPAAPRPGELALLLYPKVATQDGRHAQNPWLQELPDPVSRLAWESYACLAPETAIGLGLAEGDVVRIDGARGAASVELPVHVEPGQHTGVVAVALGYGRAGTDRFTKIGPDWIEARPTVAPGGTIGVNAAPWLLLQGGALRFDARRVALTRAGTRIELPTVQDHRSLEVPDGLAAKDHQKRDIARTATLAAYVKTGARAFASHAHTGGASLWTKDFENAGPKWGMTVDLSACTGCSSCVIACQAENNIPVVGKDEVRRHREMSWIRVDRYVSGDGDATEVSRQPMMCQHCENAPCEAVCPVLATVHSTDGLNQQVYNRCVGTRYCANTCPYKVRRFNWFDYAHEDSLENHALNPEVTVRTRGVMEKCSLCVQRIAERRLEARRRGEKIADGDIQTACQQSCPTQAIVFGDLSDPNSAIAKIARSERRYRALEELNVAPRVHYLGRVRNEEGRS